MNPIRNYSGPERRRAHRAWLAAFWAVVIISIIISSASLKIAYNATQAAKRSETAICTEIRYIEASASLNQKLSAETQNLEERKARQRAIEGALKLASDLRGQGVRCD